jgi:hypothetical protein
MNILARTPDFGRRLFRPLRGSPLAVAALTVWIAGAAYCHGYENLLTGLGSWPGSLVWSAIAVLPWFGLFEWSKNRTGQEITGNYAKLAALLLIIAAVSIGFEYLVNWSLGHHTSPAGLLILRRMPAIAATLLLIALARKDRAREITRGDAADLPSLAGVIEYVAAPDNYVELHLPGRVAMRRMTLLEAAGALRGHGFVRVHRRFLVNRAHIQAIHRQGRGSVRLLSGAEIPIGRAYYSNIPRSG